MNYIIMSKNGVMLTPKHILLHGISISLRTGFHERQLALGFPGGLSDPL